MRSFIFEWVRRAWATASSPPFTRVAPTLTAGSEVELEIDGPRRLIASLRPDRDDDATFRLTTRELEVLRLIGGGEPNKRIAAVLGISERTVRSHVTSVLAKLGLTSRTQAALFAARQGIAAAEADHASPVDHPSLS